MEKGGRARARPHTPQEFGSSWFNKPHPNTAQRRSNRHPLPPSRGGPLCPPCPHDRRREPTAKVRTTAYLAHEWTGASRFEKKKARHRIPVTGFSVRESLPCYGFSTSQVELSQEVPVPVPNPQSGNGASGAGPLRN